MLEEDPHSSQEFVMNQNQNHLLNQNHPINFIRDLGLTKEIIHMLQQGR